MSSPHCLQPISAFVLPIQAVRHDCKAYPGSPPYKLQISLSVTIHALHEASHVAPCQRHFLFNQAMLHTRSHSSGYLPVPLIATNDLSQLSSTGNDNGRKPSHDKHTSSTLPSMTASQRRTYHDELLERDFSDPRYSREKLCEYCKALQKLGRELRDDNDRLQATEHYSHRTPSIRRETDETDFSQKKLLDPIPPEEMVVAWDRSLNELRILKGSDISEYLLPVNAAVANQNVPASSYVRLPLPSFWTHWWRDSVHLYYNRRQDRKTVKDEQPRYSLFRKFSSPGGSHDSKHIREINLGELPFKIQLGRYTGSLKTLCVLLPETSSHPQMSISRPVR